VGKFFPRNVFLLLVPDKSKFAKESPGIYPFKFEFLGQDFGGGRLAGSWPFTGNDNGEVFMIYHRGIIHRGGIHSIMICEGRGLMNGSLFTVWQRLRYAREIREAVKLKKLLWVYVAILVIWGMYRLLFRLPVVVEETLFKGIVFGAPVWWAVYKAKLLPAEAVGLTNRRLLAGVYLGLFLGMGLGLVAQVSNIMRHGGLLLSNYGVTSESVGGFLLLNMMTAFWEQLLFAGLVLPVLLTAFKDEWRALWITAVLFALLHIPAMVFIQQASFLGVVLGSMLMWLLMMGAGILKLRYGSLAAPVLAQALWGMSVFLFR
jgi:hypothetical protein